MSRLLRLLVAPLLTWASGLRFPGLVAVAAALFLADLIVPDLIPLVDELILGLVTLLLARIRKDRAGGGTD